MNTCSSFSQSSSSLETGSSWPRVWRSQGYYSHSLTLWMFKVRAAQIFF